MLMARSTPQQLQGAIGIGVIVCLAAAVTGLARNQDKPRGPVTSCITENCHGSIIEHRVVHGPVAQQKCEACHVESDPASHQFVLAQDALTLCTTCHPMPERTYSHAPVHQGNCTGCHDPHGSDHVAMLVADPTQGLCLSCHHEDENLTDAFVHGPVATGACILCHEPHSSWNPSLLTAPPVQLCLGCHVEMQRVPERDRYVHEPVEGDCLSCHDAHSSNVRFQLHEDAPQLCQRCHEDTLLAMNSSPVVHGAVTQEGGCLSCHAAHYSAFPALQRREEIEECLSCHDRAVAVSDGRELTNMAALLRDNPEHHGPIREGACTTCHLPHASNEPKLLRLAYPPEFYAPYEPSRYALCFECHLPQMVQEQQGTGVTGFRDGNENLHWLHVNRQKGRTCRACHEVHASSHPFHIRDSVPFGSSGWALEIRYEQTETGGSCAPGCHVSKTYQRQREPGMPAAPQILRPEGDRP